MAGDIKRQRKSWTLQDRSKVSINILRAALAEEGDEDAQLDVAKRLLQESSETEVPERSKENARLALYWLIKSSEQGNDEATQLLKECLQSRSGLTAQNILDVKTCVNTPKYEKLTFKAARLLHRKLSNGEEFITTAQLLARMNANGRGAVTFGSCPNGAVVTKENILPVEENDEFLVEEQNAHSEKEENSIHASKEKDDFMKDVDLNETFTVSGLSGSRPKASSSPKQNLLRSFQNQSQEALDEMQLLPHLDVHFAMMQSGKKLTLSDLLNVAKDFNVGKTPKISVDERNKILSRHKWNVDSFPSIFVMQLLILAVLGNVIHVASALFYSIFLGILWSCYNCFLWKLRYRNFEDWKLAFESVLVGKWKTDKLKSRLSTKHILPHLVIFTLGPLLLPLFTQDLVAILLLSVGITVIISIQFGVRQQLLPSWQHFLLTTIVLLYYQPSFIISLMAESFVEQISILYQPLFQLGDSSQLKYLPLSIDVFTVLIFAILSTTMKLSFHDIFSKTLPDVISMLWLIKVVHICVTVEDSDFFVGVCLGLVISVLMMLIASRLETWKIFLVILSGALLTLISGLIVTSTQKEFFGLHQNLEIDEARYVEWEDYEASCHRKAWSFQSPASTQIKCSNIYGDHNNNMLVKWKGRISIVKIEKLSRSRRDPNSLEDVVFDISVGIFPSYKGDESRNWQNFLSGSTDTENTAPASLVVRTTDIPNKKEKQYLIDHILNLRTGDKIEFVGRLKGSTAGSLKPQIVDVQSIKCLSCTTADYGEFAIEQEMSSKMYLLNWLKRMISEISTHTKDSRFYKESKSYLGNLFSSIQNALSK